MNASKNRLPTIADTLIFAFPILLLCAPRGAGVFMAGVVILSVAGWRMMGAAWRDHAAYLRPLGLTVFLFLAVYLASKLYHHTHWDVLDNPSRALLAIVTCWAMARWTPNPAWLWRGVSVGLLGALAIVAYQKFGLGYERPSAFVQAIAFANMVTALALVGFARPGQERRTHMEAWGNVLCAMLILALNGTRGAFVALLVVLLPLLLVRHRQFSWRMLGIVSACIAAIVTAAVLVPGNPVSHRVGQAVDEVRMYEQGNIETSVGTRLKIWTLGVHYFVQHPWTGVGVGQFARILTSSDFCQTATSMACVLQHAHNDVIEASSTMGVPGLLALLGIFLVPAALFGRALAACRRQGNARGESLCWAGLGTVGASLICGLTQVTTAHQANMVFYAGTTGLLLALAAHEAVVTDARNTGHRDQPLTDEGIASSKI
ncbi:MULTISPECIES: O-antigen ligase family protein [unclassified Cupriavidus]|uniref:O-antigen ligase family protein n=1 Tax=Cupriavidus sp. H19C3 TaxID=3241603 RepID=UPI003BF86B73